MSQATHQSLHSSGQTAPADPRPLSPSPPLPLFPGETAWLSPITQARWLWGFLLLGAVLRLTRYLLRFPLWEDEACLSANFLDRGYLDLLRPLHYCQVAPTLFLWIQLTVIKLLGYSEYTLRLVPFLCGMASLFLFRHAAGRLLQGVALVVAVGLFAVAYPMSRYAAEAKPYGCDLLVALVLLALLVEWLRRPGEGRWLWALAACVGPAVGFSFPAMFAGGGISLVAGWVLWTRRVGRWPRVAEAAPWLVFSMVLVGSAAAVVFIGRAAVGEVNEQTMEGVHWADTFPPPATQPVGLVVWLLKIHCGGMLGYPLGGPNWGSTLSFLLFGIGLGVLVWRRQGLLLAVLLAPLGLNLVAAAMHRFPYGGHARMTLFLAPTFCILIGLGITALLAWLARRVGQVSQPVATVGQVSNPSSRGDRLETYPTKISRPLLVVLVALAVLGGGSLVRDLSHPYKSGTVLRARDFAQWFWFDLAHDSELVCFETDCKQSLSPGKVNCAWSSLYYCNQRIYSPRHARGEPPQWEQVSAARPLRWVVYRSPKEEHDSPAEPGTLERGLADMQLRWDLIGHDTYCFPAYDKSDRRPHEDGCDYVEVFKFGPKRAAAQKIQQ